MTLDDWFVASNSFLVRLVTDTKTRGFDDDIGVPGSPLYFAVCPFNHSIATHSFHFYSGVIYIFNLSNNIVDGYVCCGHFKISESYSEITRVDVPCKLILTTEFGLAISEFKEYIGGL